MNDGSRQHRLRIRRAVLALLGTAAIAASAAGCQSSDGARGTAHAGGSATAPSGSATAPSRSSTSAPAGTPGGAGSAAVRPAPDPARRPTYAISATVEPAGGSVDGQLTVHVPQGVGGDQLRFRVLANADGYGGNFHLSGTTVDGKQVEPQLTGSVLTLDRPADKATTVEMRFRYTMQKGKNSGGTLGLPSSKSSTSMVTQLLARFDTGLSMGHWYPALIDGHALARPVLPKEGDLGASPAGDVTAHITVPNGYSVISGGVNTKTSTKSGQTTYTQEGHGIRELSLVVSNQLVATQQRVGNVTVRVWSTKADGAAAKRVSGYVTRGMAIFSKDFGSYPWSELNVVEAPMPAGVGGMEWQGMFWVGPDMFTGEIAGLSGIADLVGMNLQSTGEFTVVHELAHQWWQGIVGVDQTGTGVVDEPLAQYSACLYFHDVHPAEANDVCASGITMSYQMMRTMAEPDGVADRPTYDFTNDYAYAGIVYGKAPGFYDAVTKVIGNDRLLAGLHRLVADHAFGMVTGRDVVTALQAAAPDHAREIATLWTRWMDQDHGDQDIDLNSGPLGNIGTMMRDNPDLAKLLRVLLGI